MIAPGFEVVTEGGGYNDVWLETQPMAGGMYVGPPSHALAQTPHTRPLG
jgi:hypothetical protein